MKSRPVAWPKSLSSSSVSWLDDGENPLKCRCASKASDQRSKQSENNGNEFSETTDNLVFSAKVVALLTRGKGFFSRLPLHKQLALLKHHRDPSFRYPDDVELLARKINVLPLQLSGWINMQNGRRLKFDSIADIPNSVLKILNDEYSLSAALNEDRALVLSYVLRMPTRVLLEWFEQRLSSGSQTKPETSSVTRRPSVSNTISHPSPSPSEKQPPVSTSVRQSVSPAVKRPVVLNHEHDDSSAKGFTSKQYEILMNRFKRRVILSDAEANELAAETGLPPSRVISWFQKQRRLVQSTTVNKILENLSKNLHPSRLLHLEQLYRKSVGITAAEAAELSRLWNITEEVISGWFRRRRSYELFKFQGARQTVTEEHEGVREILEAKDLSNLAAASSKVETDAVEPVDSPDSRVRQCALLVGRYEVDESSPEKPKRKQRKTRKRFTNAERAILQYFYAKNPYISIEEAEDIAVSQFGGAVYTKSVQTWFNNMRHKEKVIAKMREPPSSFHKRQSVQKASSSALKESKCDVAHSVGKKRGPTPLVIQNALFEEYRMSPVLGLQRRTMLHQRLRFPILRIVAFFHELTAQLAGKKEADLFKSLTILPNSHLSRLTSEYSRNRFVHVTRSHILANKLGLSRRTICEWFSNARLYELVTGNRFSMDIVRAEKKSSAPSSSSTSSQPANTAEKSAVHVSRNAAALMRKEYLRDPNITEERIIAVSRRFHMKRDHVRQWYKLNIPLIHPSDGIESTSDAAERSKSTPTVLETKPFTSGRSCYSQSQLKILFQTFKSFPNPSLSCIAKVSSQTGLSHVQVKKWFHRMRQKLIFVPDDVLPNDRRNNNLTDEQVAALEQEFQQHPFEALETRETLAKQLKLERIFVKQWFTKRRYHELISSAVSKQNLPARAEPTKSTVAAKSDALDDCRPSVELESSDVGQVVADGSSRCEDVVVASSDCEASKTAVSHSRADVETAYGRCSVEIASPACYVEVKTENEDASHECQQILDPTGSSEITVSQYTTGRNGSTQPAQKSKFSLSEALARISAECYGVDEHLVSCSWPDMEIDPECIPQNEESRQNAATLPEFSATNPKSTESCTTAVPESNLNLTQKPAASSESVFQFPTTADPKADLEEGPDYLLKLLADNSEPSSNNSGIASAKFEAAPQYPELQVDYLLKLLSDDIDGEAVPSEPSAELTSACAVDLSAGKQSEPAAVSRAEPEKKKHAYSSQQVRVLHHEFKKSQFLSSARAHTLSKELNLSVRRIESWFQKNKWKQMESLGSQNEKSVQKNESNSSLMAWQLFALNQEFDRNTKLTDERLEYLCEKLRVGRQPIVAWFSERSEGGKNSTS